MNLCKKVPEAPPVVSEWQRTTWCPDCEHYELGTCANPARIGSNAPCPFDDKALPLREVPLEPWPEQRLRTGVVCQGPENQMPPAAPLGQTIKDQIVKRTGGRIQMLSVEVLTGGIVIQGLAPCYYLKQLVLQGVLDVIGSVAASKVNLNVEVASRPTVCGPDAQ